MKHLVGSQYFFSSYDDFKPHDIDYVELRDDPRISTGFQIRFPDKDYFILRRKPKEQLIEDILNTKLPMLVGKFLIPEFNKEIGFTIEDLSRLKPIFDKLDPKHFYEAIIYQSYIENNAFILTDDQRLKAYECYKKYREL